MGEKIADQYSLLHFSVGTVAYFLKFSFLTALILHLLFEYFENTENGVKIINRYIIKPGVFKWPGEKRKPDSYINSLFDNLFFIFGWILAFMLDKYGQKNKW